MRRTSRLLIALFLVILTAFSAYGAEAVPKKVLNCCNSVVRIMSDYGDSYATGSGFVIYSDNSETLILTNHHVVEDFPKQIYVLLNTETDIQATVAAYDKDRDLAVLRVSFPLGFKPLSLSKQSAEKGDAVYVIGYPGAADILSNNIAVTNADSTITDGIVSAKRVTKLTEFGKDVELLQVSAAINPGNSGGPVIDKNGNVVGISTYSVEDSQGIFGAVSGDEIKTFLTDHEIAFQKNNPLLKWSAFAVAVALIILVILLVIKEKKKRENLPEAFSVFEGSEDSIETQVQKQRRSFDREKAKRVLKRVLVAVLCVATVGAIGAYGYCYYKAIKFVEAKDFDNADRFLPLKGVTYIHDPQIITYTDAGKDFNNAKYEDAKEKFDSIAGYREANDYSKECAFNIAKGLFEQGKYEEAKEKFSELSGYYSSDYYLKRCDYLICEQLFNEKKYDEALEKSSKVEGAEFWTLTTEIQCAIAERGRSGIGLITALEDLGTKATMEDQKRIVDGHLQKAKEKVYKEAVDEYNRGMYSSVKLKFEALGDYKNAKDYSLVAGCMNSPTMAVNEKDQLFLLMQKGFSDAAKPLVANNQVTKDVFKGTWKTADGKKYLVIGDTYEWNLPCSDNRAGYVQISSGVLYWNRDKDAMFMDYVPFFRINPQSNDKIIISCFSDNSIYEMKKVK